ncbi:MAG: tripartite tricarboxylate transporter substrate binding protein, partial [Candidatus Tectimicrobiota bacterium]
MKKSYGLGTWGVLVGVFLGMCLLPFWQSSAGAWEPKKPVEWIVMAGKGGGADRISRLMQGVILENKWVSRPITVINKPGGAGAEALTY